MNDDQRLQQYADEYDAMMTYIECDIQIID